jgi:hypothetical protein
MADLGPWLVTARSAEHAEYLIRSRAEQRGVRIADVAATGGPHMWEVTATSDDKDAAAAASLGDDTGVLHVDGHSSRRHDSES